MFSLYSYSIYYKNTHIHLAVLFNRLHEHSELFIDELNPVTIRLIVAKY